MVLGENVKRIAIYFFYDKDGIVDDYIPFQLRDLKENVDELLIVVNGELAEEGKKKLELFSTDVLVRDNIGFDVWAYKAGIEYFGWDKLTQYDEMILMNFTMFGPLYPTKEVFEKMSKQDLDFWGITKHHKVDFDAFGTCKYGYIPEHIQSSFLVIRNTLLVSTLYREFWAKMPMIKSYNDSVGYYEAIFTKDFKDMGFKEDVYCNTEDLREHSRYPLMMMADELVINRHCPYIKRKSFSQNYYDILSETVGQATKRMYEYVEKQTSYNTDLIWNNILRTDHMYDIKNIAQLNYILPDKVLNSQVNSNRKIALVFHLYFLDLIEISKKYISNMPSYSDIYITTNSKEKKMAIEKAFSDLHFKKIKVITIQNRGRDVSALLVGAKDFIFDYDIVCFAHDKKTTQIKPYAVGDGFAYKCLENVLGSAEYVENIISTFEVNRKMGLLTPPPPNHSSFFQTFHSTWANNYNNTYNLIQELNLDVPIHWSKEPIAPCGTMFWFRPKAMKILFDKDWKYEDFPTEPNDFDGTLLHAIERIYPYVVQHHRYFCGWCMTTSYSEIETTNIYFMIHDIVKTMSLNSTNNINSMIAANNDILLNIPLHSVIKVKLRKIIPKPLWNFMKKIYKFFRRK